jgi:hypothetical protein
VRAALPARHAHALKLHVRHRFERKAAVLERREVPGTAGAEAEIAPDQQPLHAESTHQDLVDEALSRHGGEARIEARHVHVLDPGLRQQLQLVSQACNSRRRRVGGEELAGMRLEGEDARRQFGFTRLGGDPVDERAMTPVHAVEVSDRRRTPAPGALQRAVRDDHGRG